jgi:hypothetical protein
LFCFHLWFGWERSKGKNVGRDCFVRERKGGLYHDRTAVLCLWGRRWMCVTSEIHQWIVFFFSVLGRAQKECCFLDNSANLSAWPFSLVLEQLSWPVQRFQIKIAYDSSAPRLQAGVLG